MLHRFKLVECLIALCLFCTNVFVCADTRVSDSFAVGQNSKGQRYVDCINPMFKSFGIRFSLVPAKDTERIIIAGDLAATSLLEFKEPLKVSLEKIFYPRKFEIMDFTLPHSTNSELLDLIGQFKSFKPSLLIFDVASQVPFKTVLRSRQSFWRRWLNMFDEPQNFSPEAGKRADVFKKHMQAILEAVKTANLNVLFVTVPCNLRYFAPSGMIPVNAEFLKGFSLYTIGKTTDSIKAARDCFVRYIEQEPLNPFGYFFLGRCHDFFGQTAKADANYAKARNFDVNLQHPRPDALLNDAVRVLSIDKAVTVCDFEKEFYAQKKQLRGVGFIGPVRMNSLLASQFAVSVLSTLVEYFKHDQDVAELPKDIGLYFADNGPDARYWNCVSWVLSDMRVTQNEDQKIFNESWISMVEGICADFPQLYSKISFVEDDADRYVVKSFLPEDKEKIRRICALYHLEVLRRNGYSTNKCFSSLPVDVGSWGIYSFAVGCFFLEQDNLEMAVTKLKHFCRQAAVSVAEFIVPVVEALS